MTAAKAVNAAKAHLPGMWAPHQRGECAALNGDDVCAHRSFAAAGAVRGGTFLSSRRLVLSEPGLIHTAYTAYAAWPRVPR
jgi:hypothetical protein